MHNHETRHGHKSHVNSFVDLNGIPYLLAEYVDRRNLRQLDRSFVRSEILVDQRESMRAIVDINVDDIGTRSDGTLNIIGNNSKQRALMAMTENMAEQLNHQFDVLRRGIVIRVNYQLENQRTGQVIRSMTEDLRIQDRFYFIDINPRDINDNAIVVNFSNTMISTINEFTHGRDPMVLRVTSVQMFYECLPRDPGVARICQGVGPYQRTPELDYYNYHAQLQNRHIFGPNGCHYEGIGHEPPDMICPPTWSMFSRYYHFDGNGHDVVLHDQEINDLNMRTILVPCGTIQVNRAFLINPGHRIIFKFSVWKNDATIVSDALPLARAIRTPYINCYESIPCPPEMDPGFTMDPSQEHHYHHYHYPSHPSRPSCPSKPVVGGYPTDALKELERRQRETDRKQSEAINTLVNAVNGLREVILAQHAEATVPDEVNGVPVPPTRPTRPRPPRPVNPTDPIVDKLDELGKLLEEIKNQSANDECDHTEIDQQIADIQQELDDIRTNGTDEAVADKLKDLEDTLVALQEQLAEECEKNHPNPIPGEQVGELIDKIQNA